MQFNLITILGPTAVGKTSLGAKLAKHFNGEIISADSRQVYTGLDIGTGKDIADYTVDGFTVPHHLIDIATPHDEFNLFLFNKLFYNAHSEIESRAKIPFMVGGTGLFLHSILKGYALTEVDFKSDRYIELNKMDLPRLKSILEKINPSLHNTTDLLIKERVIKAIIISEANEKLPANNNKKIHSLVIGVKMDRDQIKKSITKRLRQRLEEGMIEEVQKLIDEGVTLEKLLFWGLEYKYVGMHLHGELSYNDMFQKLNSSIHKFAKRQMTWFRKIEREGITIHWLDGPDYDTAAGLIEEYYIQKT